MRTTSKHLFTVHMGGEVVATYRQAASVAKFVNDPTITYGEQITVDITRDNRVMNIVLTTPDGQALENLRKAVAQLDAACHVA